jgi:hypothetical protein
MYKYFLLIFFLLILVGCKSLDITMTAPEQFKQLKDNPIIITTKEEVDIQLSNKSTNSKGKLLLNELPVTNYKINADSIIIEMINFMASIPFSKIEKIECRGVIDNDIGFVAEKELLMYMDESNSFLATTSGVILGLLTGGASALLISKAIHSYDLFTVIFFPFSLGGAISGGIIGNNIYLSSRIDDALLKIKAARFKK